MSFIERPLSIPAPQLVTGTYSVLSGYVICRNMTVVLRGGTEKAWRDSNHIRANMDKIIDIYSKYC